MLETPIALFFQERHPKKQTTASGNPYGNPATLLDRMAETTDSQQPYVWYRELIPGKERDPPRVLVIHRKN